MKNSIKFLILPIVVVTTLVGFAPSAYAVTPLDVQFIPDPLFNKPNFLPLDTTSGTVTVTNNSDSTQTIITEAINILDNDNFGSLLRLKIDGSSGNLYDDSLANFFSTSGEVPLGTIVSGGSRTFTYTVLFIDSSDNSYQGKTLGFDVCVGFQGGTSRCGNTVVGGENDTGDGNGGGGGTDNPPSGGTIPGSGGGGGGGGGGVGLAIYNEQVVNVDVGAGTALIQWNTNLYSTSQVIYGPTPPSYTLDLGLLPNLGYPLGSPEYSTKVVNHAVLITGLSPSTTYVYRVVSRASPPTVSVEHQFTTLALASTQTGSAPVPFVDGATGQAGSDEIGSPSTGSTGSPQAGAVEGTSSEEIATGTPTLQLAAALFGLPAGLIEFFQSFGFWFLLLLILIALIIWFVRRRYSNQ
jgi:hypothetical protein